MNDLLRPLYEEFGREMVGIIRRELTIEKGEPPNYVELVAELMRRQTPPLLPAPGGEGCSKGGDHEWGIDGAHSNEFCKKCFVGRPK